MLQTIASILLALSINGNQAPEAATIVVHGQPTTRQPAADPLPTRLPLEYHKRAADLAALTR